MQLPHRPERLVFTRRYERPGDDRQEGSAWQGRPGPRRKRLGQAEFLHCAAGQYSELSFVTRRAERNAEHVRDRRQSASAQETAGTLCATFNTSNNLVVTGTVTAQSSIVLKDNVETIPNALSRVLNLRGVEWDYKSNGTHNVGVVAEEIEKEFPCLVHTGDDGIKSVAYANIVGVLIEAVKDLKKEIDQLRGV